MHYNVANSYLFVNGTGIIKFKVKDSEIHAYSLCLGNISKDWSQDNMKKTGFNGYIYDFSTDYNAIAVSDILDIHKYLMKKNEIVEEMFKFIKHIFISTLTFFGCLSNINPLEYVSMKNRECKVRPDIVGVNSNNSIFYPFSIKTNRYSGNCNNISDPYAKICVPDTVKNLNFKVFNLMSLTNETRHIKKHESCKCICRLDGIICNSKQRWYENKCRCECKELVDKGVCGKEYIWNPSNCECECDKSCDIG